MDNETDIWFKDTHTGQYMHFSSYTPLSIKTVWIKPLELRKYVAIRNNRASKICSNQKLLDYQMKKILFLSWHGFLNYVSKPLLHRSKSNLALSSSNNSIE